MKIKGLRFEGEINWDNVWQLWFKREGARKEWQQVAKEKGWQSWKEWRDAWISNFNAQTRQWFRYTIINPLETVPYFLIGPTQSWQNNFPEDEHNKHTFATLIKRVNYDTNSKVQKIMKNFPDSTEFIGVIMPDKSIIVIEGHHRATALAIIAQQKKEMFFQNLPTIVLTSFEEGEKTLRDTMLTKGSMKERLK